METASAGLVTGLEVTFSSWLHPRDSALSLVEVSGVKTGSYACVHFISGYKDRNYHVVDVTAARPQMLLAVGRSGGIRLT